MTKTATPINQNQRVLNHLIDHGYITQVVASSYSIRRLASRIFDIGKEGIVVEKQRRTDDAGVPYMHYSLADGDRAHERMRRDDLGLTYKMLNIPIDDRQRAAA